MSYDVCLIDQEGKDIDCDLNITSNLCKMFNWAFDAEYWVNEVENKSTFIVAVKILMAINKMIIQKSEAEKFNSSNGWGVYDDALRFLLDFYRYCADNPTCTVLIDR